MGVIETPWAYVLISREGSKRVYVEGRRGDQASAPLHRVLSGQFKDFEIVDSNGSYFPHVSGRLAGIDWSLYRMAGVLAPVVLLFSLVFFTVMVRVRVSAQEPVRLTLKEVREKLGEIILSNPDAYTYAPAKEIVGRFRSAKDIKSLIRSIVRD